jgi:hypothetical protein
VKNFAFHFYRSVARFIGSIFFPLFSAWGEDSFAQGDKPTVFTRYFGFVSVINVLRFFKTPVVFLIERGKATTFWWKILIAGGQRVEKFDSSQSSKQLSEKIIAIMNNGEVPVFFLGSLDLKTETSLISSFDEQHLLFLAIVGCESCYSLGFIPIVKDTRAFCGTIPLFGLEREKFNGIKCLEFIEKALELTPRFEIPTFFCTHKKYVS